MQNSGQNSGTTSTSSAGQAAKAAPSILGPGTRIVGQVSCEGDLVVEGHIEGGPLRVNGCLTVSASATVQCADTEVSEALVVGLFQGTLRARDSVRIHHTGRVIGDILAPRVVFVSSAADRPAEKPRPVTPAPAAPRVPAPTPAPVAAARPATPTPAPAPPAPPAAAPRQAAPAAAAPAVALPPAAPPAAAPQQAPAPPPAAAAPQPAPAAPQPAPAAPPAAAPQPAPAAPAKAPASAAASPAPAATSRAIPSLPSIGQRAMERKS